MVNPDPMQLITFCLAATMLLWVRTSADAESRWYQCTAWGGSHTGHYTFRIDAETCEVFWKQIEMSLDVETCDAPLIVALKPFAPAKGYVLRFNLETGAFSDHVPGWADRGACRRTGSG